MPTFPNARIARAALAAFCLSLLPSLALAQASDDEPAKTAPKKKAKKATKPAEEAKPAAAPQKAAPAAEKPAAAPPAPRREEVPPPPPRRAHRPVADPVHPLLVKLEAEGLLGLSIPFESGINTGFKLEAGAFYGIKELSPTMLLQIGGKVAFTYNGMPSPIDGSFWLFDIVPIARIRFNIADKLYAMADGGAGLGIAHSKVTIPFFGTQTSNDAAFLLKLGGGIGYDINEQISLVGEPALNIYIKSGSTTELSLMVGAAMKL
jgi:hypothetical protein